MNAELEKVNQSQSLVKNGFSADDYKLIKDKICEGAPDSEIEYFLRVAALRNLNPLTSQICLIGRWDSIKNKKAYTIQTTIGGLRTIADRTKKYAPSNVPTVFDYDQDGNLFSATAFVKKFARNEWHQVSETAFWDEFVQTNKEGKPAALWKSKSRLMLAKCAEAMALRKAFPDELSGLYSSDEMESAINNQLEIPGAVEVTNEARPEEPRCITELQRNRLYAIAKSDKDNAPLPRWVDEQCKDYLGSLGLASSLKITQGAMYNAICEYFKTHAGHYTNTPGQQEIELSEPVIELEIVYKKEGIV